jgi:hypothetical protein
MEFGMVTRVLQDGLCPTQKKNVNDLIVLVCTGEFYEGVRSLLVPKYAEC